MSAVTSSRTFKVKADELVTLEDGYKYYWPKDFPHGCFSAHTLREIADELDRLNSPWDEAVRDVLHTY